MSVSNISGVLRIGPFTALDGETGTLVSNIQDATITVAHAQRNVAFRAGIASDMRTIVNIGEAQPVVTLGLRDISAATRTLLSSGTRAIWIQTATLDFYAPAVAVHPDFQGEARRWSRLRSHYDENELVLLCTRPATQTTAAYMIGTAAAIEAVYYAP